jgi:Ca2+-binding EF-hand superfamily protein
MKTKSLSLLTVGALALALTGSLSANDHKDEFKAMDANGDGNVSQAEHLAFSQSLFAQSDADRDANVTAAEWDTAATAARPGEKMDPAATAAQLRLMDTDGNGKISASESDAFATSLFAKSDKNGDGVLTKAEYKSASKDFDKDLKKAKKQQSGS